MNKTEGRLLLWDDATPEVYPTSGHIYETFKRLYRMSLAYATKGSTLYQNPQLMADLSAGLDWAYENQYSDTMTWQVNVHHWEINIPTVLVNITTLLYDELTTEQRTNYMNAVHKFASDPTTYATSTTPSYGANRLSESLPIVIRGILIKDGSRLALVRDRLSDYDALNYPFVDEGNGWYRDGSFISHNAHAYTGTYGLEQYGKLVMLLDLLSNTPWQITDPRVENVMSWTMDGYLPLVHKGRLMDMVNGRSIARQGGGDYAQGNALIDYLLKVINFAQPEEAAVIKQTIKEWVIDKTEHSYLERASIPNYFKVRALLEDPTVPAAPPLSYQQYAGMDRAVQQRPTYAFGLSMFSKRVFDFESINDENKRGWYTASGMTYLYDSDHVQYNDNYWATVNMKRLPGTTVDAEYARPEKQGNRLSTKSWVGGVEVDGEFGASGMELEGIGTSLNARKSWFAFDNEIVALGSNITSTDNRTIETIVENRRLDSTKQQALTVNGIVQPSELGWNATLDGVRQIHLEGKGEGSSIGYVFPGENVTVKALREERSGSWQDISASTDPTVFNNTFMTLWMDHGKNPTQGSYSYIMLPDRSAAEVSQYASQPEVSILEQNEYVHAVRDNQLKITAALFWQDVKRTVGQLITVDKKAAVAVKESSNELEISVSDPTQENKGIIEVEINRSAAGVVTADPSIKVLRLAPTIQLAVQTHGNVGRTQNIKLSLQNSNTYSALVLPTIADASVHNGNNASTNLGSATTMAVIDAPDESKNKKAYTKFDLSPIVSVDRAILRIHTSSTSGEAAVLTATGADNSWAEGTITWNNAPLPNTGVLDSVWVNGREQVYELDVTDYIRGRLARDRQATLVLSGTDYESLAMSIHSKEHSYGGPQLLVQGSFLENTPVVTINPTFGDGLRAGYQDNFEPSPINSTPQNWQITGTGAQAIVSEPAGAMNDHEVRLVSGASGLTASVPFAAQEGIVQAELRVRANQTSVPLKIELKSEGHAAPAMTLAFTGSGRITATDGEKDRLLQTYTSNKDYKIKIILDTVNGDYDVYVDEVRKAQRFALNQATPSIGALAMSIPHAGVFQVDDVAIGEIDTRPPARTDEDVLHDDVEEITLPKYTVNDSFNTPGTSVPQGWSIASTGGPVGLTDSPNSNNRSLEIAKTSASPSSALRTFNQLTGKVIVDYWYRSDQKITSGAPYVRDAGNREVISILFSNNGNIQAFDGATAKNLMPYELGKWYHIKLVMDTAAKKTDVIINGKTCGTGFTFRNVAVTGVAKLNFFSNATPGTIKIDNVVVTSEDDSYSQPDPLIVPRIQIDTPKQVLPDQSFQVGMQLHNAGYAANVERVQLTYDSSVFSYEGLEGGDPAAEYMVDSAVAGLLTMTWTKGGGGQLPSLNFKAKPTTERKHGAIRLYSADLYLAETETLMLTPTDNHEIVVDKYNTNIQLQLADQEPTVTSVTYGDRSALRVTVTGGQQAPNVIPQGTVTFRDGTEQIGVQTLAADGTAELELPPLSLGDHLITAQYSGDDTFKASVSTLELKVMPDQLPPVTTTEVMGTTGQNGWYVTDAHVTLNAEDSQSGVALTEYSLTVVQSPKLTTVTEATYDGSSGAGTTAPTQGYVPYSGPITLGEGVYSVGYRSKDRSGNYEIERQITVKVDHTVPVFQLNGNGKPVAQGAVYADVLPVAFTLQTDDNLSGVALKSITVDGVPYTEGTLKNWTGAYGPHLIQVVVTDTAGNVVEQAYTVTVITAVDALRMLLNGFIEDGQIQEPLATLLRNIVNVIEHFDGADKNKQAVKHLGDMIKHLNNNAMQDRISSDAKQGIENIILPLIETWSKG
jgi:hyaluronate lyase